MSAAKIVIVTVLQGLLYAAVWRERGDVLEMDEYLAKKLATRKYVVIGEHELPDEGVPQKKPQQRFAVDDFPGSDELVAANLLTPDDVREFIGAHGDGWFKKVKGIGKATAAEIAERLTEASGSESGDNAGE